MKPTPSSELSRELFGQVFYFQSDPAAIREQLLGTLLELDRTLGVEFTRVSDDGERSTQIRGSAQEYLEQRFGKHDFGSPLFLRLVDGSKDVVHSTRIELWAAPKANPGFVNHLPSHLYVELDPGVDVDFRWSLFQSIWIAGFFELGFGNRVVAPHLEQMPRSGSLAARRIRKSGSLLKGFYETWENPSYRSKVMQGTQVVEGPNEFMAFGERLAGRIPVAETLRAAGFEGSNFTYLPGEDFCFFRVRSSAQLEHLSAQLRGFYCEFDKPQMFWKPEEWAKWRSSVLCGELELAT